MNLDLQSLIRPLDGYNKDVPGYDHRKGWNDAIMHIMDLQRATTAPASAAEPVAWQRRIRAGYRTHTDDAGSWEECSGLEAKDRFRSEPRYEYRPLYDHPPLTIDT